MLQQKLNKKTDYKFSEYYRICDSVNKYNLLSFFDTPSLKEITVELPVENILNAFVSKTRQIADNGQILSLLLVYILLNLFPYINFNKSSSLKIINKNGYSLKINLNNSQRILSFLHDICDKLKLESLNSLTDIKNQKYFIITKLCNTYIFSELKNILDKHISSISSKELHFLVKFKIFKSQKLQFNKNIIQNFPFLNK